MGRRDGVINQKLPNWIWRGLGWTAVLLMVTTVAGIGLISTGVFDPKPLNGEFYEQPLAPQNIASESRDIVWLPEIGLPGDSFTLRLTAAHQSGEEDIAYGLVLGDEARYLVTAVSPLGYVAVWEEARDNADTKQVERQQLTENSKQLTVDSQQSINVYLPWQAWPHVRGGQVVNEIWLDVVDGRVAVRVNRELLWQADVPLAGKEVGLWAESFGAAAVVDFQMLQYPFLISTP